MKDSKGNTITIGDEVEYWGDKFYKKITGKITAYTGREYQREVLIFIPEFQHSEWVYPHELTLLNYMVEDEEIKLKVGDIFRGGFGNDDTSYYFLITHFEESSDGKKITCGIMFDGNGVFDGRFSVVDWKKYLVKRVGYTYKNKKLLQIFTGELDG